MSTKLGIHISLILCVCRFVYAHLVGKCRRQVILDYFGEESQMATATGECCDVCSSANTTDSITADYQNHFQVITAAVCEIPDKGEKKVSSENVIKQCALLFLVMYAT